MKILKKIPLINQIRGYRLIKKEIRGYLEIARLNRHNEKEHTKNLRYASTRVYQLQSNYPMYIQKASHLRDLIELEKRNLEKKL